MINDVKPNDDDFAKLGQFDDDSPDPINKPIQEPDPSPTKDVKPDFVPNPFEPKEEPPTPDPTPEPNKQEVLLERILQKKGIQGVDKILYEEGDEVVEKNFFDLPEEDQLEILANDSDLTEEEAYYIEQARSNNLSLTDLIEYHVNQQLQQSQSQQPDNLVDDYTDEELYVLDLKARLGDAMTDDEILTTLQKELEAPEIFKKKVDALRKEYKALEEQEVALREKQNTDAKEAQHNEYKTSITELVNSVEDVGGVILEDPDKVEMLQFLVERDVNGQTAFDKQMKDPENKFLAAWAILKATDTFEIIKEHYENQIKSLKKTATATPKKDATVVVQATTPKIRSVEDLNTFND